MMADLQGGVIIDEGSLQVVDSHSVDPALFTVKFDAIQVHHCREDGQLHITLLHARNVE